MRRAIRLLAGIIVLASSAAAVAVQGDGLTTSVENLSWSRWQGRLSLNSIVQPWQVSLGRGDSAGLRVESIGLLGDYYFSRSLVGHGISGGFRTTGGLFHGPRGQLFGSAEGPSGESGQDVATLPYLGVGYSGLSLKGRWSFNADLGMLALSPGNSVKLGRVVGGTQSLDDLLRDMRLAPILHLGVSYSF